MSRRYNMGLEMERRCATSSARNFRSPSCCSTVMTSVPSGVLTKEVKGSLGHPPRHSSRHHLNTIRLVAADQFRELHRVYTQVVGCVRARVETLAAPIVNKSQKQLFGFLRMMLHTQQECEDMATWSFLRRLLHPERQQLLSIPSPGSTHTGPLDHPMLDRSGEGLNQGQERLVHVTNWLLNPLIYILH